MKNTLVIVTHPNLSDSVINKRWVEELEKHQDKITIHELYKTYPDGNFNVEKEQALIEKHQNLVFQFPLYWYSSPPLLKKWLDEIFTYGWAYGRLGKKLKGKKIAVATSAGGKEEDFVNYGVTIEDVLLPFKLSSIYVNANYHSPFVLYGALIDGIGDYSLTSDEIDKSSKSYLNWLLSI